ncbi:single-stranded DNA-binding protein [Streptomyces sp. NPDC058045]|uniref:single-stranded DNA-binding protein n=1 Tax=Streptomyces sp. NPDC058045 TaxID=3346311 RepID=UPI0036E9898E
MSETMVAVTGNVATAPVYRETPGGGVARFRLAVTARHRDRTGEGWVDGHTNFFTVWAWRSLGINISASLSVGDPVLVQGRLKVRDEERGGQRWSSADIEAQAVGHDLTRGTSAFRRIRGDGAAAPPVDAAPSADEREQAQQPGVEGELAAAGASTAAHSPTRTPGSGAAGNAARNAMRGSGRGSPRTTGRSSVSATQLALD